jgi:hypothetical protein
MGGCRRVKGAEQHRRSPTRGGALGEKFDIAQVADAPTIVAPERVDLCRDAPAVWRRRAVPWGDHHLGGGSTVEGGDGVIADRKVGRESVHLTDVGAVLENERADRRQCRAAAFVHEPQRMRLGRLAHQLGEENARGVGRLVPVTGDVVVAGGNAQMVAVVGHVDIVPAPGSIRPGQLGGGGDGRFLDSSTCRGG